FSRVGQISGQSSTDVYTEYIFTGLSRRVKRDCDNASGFKANQTILNLDSGSADQYSSLDPFGRVVSQKTTDKAGSPVTKTEIKAESQRDGSPKYAQEQLAILEGRSAAHTYDGLHRLSQTDMGRLKSTPSDGVITEWSIPKQQIFTMDILGNMTTVNNKNSGTNGNDTRVHNAQNQLTSRTIDGQAGALWVNDNFNDNNT